MLDMAAARRPLNSPEEVEGEGSGVAAGEKEAEVGAGVEGIRGGYFSSWPIFLLNCHHLTAQQSFHRGHNANSELVQFTVV